MARGPLAVKPRGIECRCVARQNIDSGLCYMQCNCCFADSDSNYSTPRISVAVADMSTIRCVLYFTFAAKYSAHQPFFHYINSSLA